MQLNNTPAGSNGVLCTAAGRKGREAIIQEWADHARRLSYHGSSSSPPPPPHDANPGRKHCCDNPGRKQDWEHATKQAHHLAQGAGAVSAAPARAGDWQHWRRPKFEPSGAPAARRSGARAG